MREMTGAILVLAGSVLVAAGLVADGLTHGSSGGYGTCGYVLGAIAGIPGLLFLFGGTLRRAWDAIPTDEKRPEATGSRSYDGR